MFEKPVQGSDVSRFPYMIGLFHRGVPAPQALMAVVDLFGTAMMDYENPKEEIENFLMFLQIQIMKIENEKECDWDNVKDAYMGSIFMILARWSLDDDCYEVKDPSWSTKKGKQK